MNYSKLMGKTLFQKISEESIKCINQMTIIEKNFKQNELIVEFGEKLDYVFVILEGVLKTNEYTLEGKEIVSSYYDSSEAFPFYLIFSGVKNYPYNVYCFRDAKVLFLPRDQLLN